MCTFKKYYQPLNIDHQTAHINVNSPSALVLPCVCSWNVLLNGLPIILMLQSSLCQIKRHSVAFIGINYSAHPATGGAEGQWKPTYLSSSLLNMNKSPSVYERRRTLGPVLWGCACCVHRLNTKQGFFGVCVCVCVEVDAQEVELACKQHREHPLKSLQSDSQSWRRRIHAHTHKHAPDIQRLYTGHQPQHTHTHTHTHTHLAGSNQSAVCFSQRCNSSKWRLPMSLSQPDSHS